MALDLGSLLVSCSDLFNCAVNSFIKIPEAFSQSVLFKLLILLPSPIQQTKRFKPLDRTVYRLITMFERSTPYL